MKESECYSVTGLVGAHCYTCNGLDTRMSKTANGMNTQYLRDGAYVTDPVIWDSGATYTPGISERRSNATRYLHSGLKNASAQSDSAQAITATRQYDAFGMVTNQTGAWNGPFGYAGGFGYQEDETGLRLLGHRYYDPSTGRFLTRDPIKDGRNWYAYCDNNPVKRIDADGLSWHDPMVVYVDPNFKGKVRVVGEPGLGLEQCYLDVPAGYHSDPSMDVDYIEITYPDGSQVVVFAYGTKNPFDDIDEPELTTIDANGKVHNPCGGALRSVGGDLYSPFWLFSGRNGFSKKAPSGIVAYKGKPKLGKPKRRTKKGLGRSTKTATRGGIRHLAENDIR